MILKYIIEEEIIVKDFLVKMGLSRKTRKKVRVQDIIYINNEKAKNYYLLKKGDILELRFSEKPNEDIFNSTFNFDIKYEDENILIIVKPRDISSQPSKKHLTDNVISSVKQYFFEKGIESNVHIVTRLDYCTSGVMIIAKNGITHYELSKVNITKKYLSEVEGFFENESGKINKNISRYPAPSIKRYIDENGKIAITQYKVLKKYHNSSLVEAKLETGRTHQIRLHFSSMGHPIIGDELYGEGKDFLRLHCYYVSFINPFTKDEIKIYDYPDWIRKEDVCQIS